MRLPAIPTRVPSPLGPVKVKPVIGLATAAAGPCCGVWDHPSRSILIDADLRGAVAWQTLLHELVHVALMDAGVNNHMTEATVESVCDSVATLFTTALRSGTFAVKGSPKGARTVAQRKLCTDP